MPEKKIRIYLVDDHKIFVKGIASILEGEPDMQVIGHTYDGESALSFLRVNDVDVLITDVHMPGLNGIELAGKIKEEFPEMRVIGLSMYDKPEIIRDLISSG